MRAVQLIALNISSHIPLPATLSVKSRANDSIIESIKASDDSRVACRVWRAHAERCVVLYLHGIEGHSQWFEPTARVLSERGITVYAPDRRGSGLNADDRGHLSSLKVFVNDVESILRHISLTHPSAPLVLFANCWSAKAAAVIARRNHSYFDQAEPVKLSGIVMTCPAIVTKADFDFMTKLKIAFHSFAGEKYRRRTWPVPLTTEMLTDNPTYLEFLHDDPLRLKLATASFFRETFILGLMAHKFAKQIELPLLLLQAENDQIVDVEKLKRWFERVGSSDKVWRLYSGATHSLDFDAKWFDDYTRVLTDWLIRRSEAVTQP